MAHFTGDSTSQQRPTMRRKSSAQNLLSSFKPSASPIPPPLTLAGPSTANPNAVSSFNVPITPVVATPLLRENYDTQANYLDPVPITLSSGPSPQPGQGTSVEYLRDLVQKRIITLTYIRSIHEGKSHWFHTVLVSQPELERVFNNFAMKRRTYRFAILGLSLSTFLDINQPQDLLRALLNAITEYDQAKEESDNKSSKMRIKFNKGKNPKKGVSGLPEYYHDTLGDASYLLIPSIPFPLDYHQTLVSFIDVLSEVYNRISRLLGPSTFSHSSQHMMGPLGLLSPQPGVSYLFSGSNIGNPIQGLPYQNPTSGPGLQDTETSGSLWSIANASNVPHGMMNIPPAVSWTNALGEMVLKIDGKLKKITSILLKDLDTVARNAIREELSSLDPLLRNTNVPDDALKGAYDFEGI